MQQDDFYLGKQIGNYRIVRQLGVGGFGSVYQGQHIIFDDKVAIKILHASLRSNQERDCFFHEARILKTLQHSNILRVLDAGIYDQVCYIVMSYASGGSLRDRLNQKSEEKLTQAETLKILEQIGKALHNAHENHIIHRDLKPDNILFDAQGNAFLADFGISVLLEKTSSVDIIGTPAYMAPEQFQGKVSSRSDEYSLGCIAYELFTGQRPFTVPGGDIFAWGWKHFNEAPIPPRNLNRNIPSHIEKAILKSLAKEREQRYDNVALFISALHTSDKTKEGLDEGFKLRNAQQSQKIISINLINGVSRLLSPEADNWEKKGLELHKIGRYKDALYAYEQALELEPDFDEVYFHKANLLFTLKQYEEALVTYEQAMHLYPSYTDLYIYKAKTLLNLQRYEEALQTYEQAIRLDPTFATAYHGKGNVLSNLNRDQEALHAYEQAIQLDPTYAAAYSDKGKTLLKLSRSEEALAVYEQAIRLNPTYVNYYGKGISLSNLKRNEEALAAYEQAIRLNPTHAATYSDKGVILAILNRYEEALAACEQAIQLDSTLTVAYVCKGKVLSKLERSEEALAAIEQATRLDPTFATAYHGKGNILSYLKRYEEAVHAFEQAIQLNPSYTSAYANKGIVLYQLKRYEDALYAYEQAIQLNPAIAYIYVNKGFALLQIDREKEAQQMFYKASQLGHKF